MSKRDPLLNVRADIDRIDAQLQALISERAECALEVARIKQEQGDSSAFYRPEREAQVLATVRERNQGPLSDSAVSRLFQEIMSACLNLQQPMQVGYLGPRGTFTEAAVIQQFGHAVETVPVDSIAAVFREVEAGALHFGVVPIENSTEGAVTHTLDLFVHSPLQICSEVEVRIHHHLLAKKGLAMTAVERVYAHQMAHAQCRAWLNNHLPGVELIDVASNAEAARRIAAESEAGSAAIASLEAAGIYELETLASNIEDEPDNTTRFLVVGRTSPLPSGADKTSLMLATANRPGALVAILEPLSSRSISMTRIESRPSRRGVWEYLFFIDISGHHDDENVAAALAELQQESVMLKVLGSYPQAPSNS